MLLRAAQQNVLLRAGLRALSCCAAATEVQFAAANPGSVTEYQHHLLLQLPRPAAATSASPAAAGAWWPSLIEREPAVLAAFAAVARHQQLVDGKVKITAFDDLGAAAPDDAPKPDSCHLLAFPAGVRYNGLSLDQVGTAVALALANDPKKLMVRATERRALLARQAPLPNLLLFVCCHAARDARCGEAGPPLASALRRLIRERGLEGRIQVLATSHVGGHKYAGNVLVYGAVHPCDGDWFGGVNSTNAEAFFDALLATELDVDGGAGDPALRPFWRGRMGLSKEEQLELWEQGGGIEEVGEASDDATDADSDGEADVELERLMRQRFRRMG